jgi:hypothetical protein
MCLKRLHCLSVKLKSETILKLFRNYFETIFKLFKNHKGHLKKADLNTLSVTNLSKIEFMSFGVIASKDKKAYRKISLFIGHAER